MTQTNLPQFLASSKAAHKRMRFANQRAALLGAKHMQGAIQARIPPPRGAGGFSGSKAKGILRSDVIISRLKQIGGEYSIDVQMNPRGASLSYQLAHEKGVRVKVPHFGKVFYLIDARGQIKFFRVFRIRRKRYFATGWREGAASLPSALSAALIREIRVR